MEFARRIAHAQQCPITLTREVSGYQLYIPCPACLETHQEREIADPKYSIGVDKFLGTGAYNPNLNGAVDMDKQMALLKSDTNSSICMRTRDARTPHRYSISELLAMSPVSERLDGNYNLSASIVGGAGSADRESYWEPDPETGIMCPPPPGKVVPITELPDDHPACQYLIDRGYDLARLEEQLAVGFCYEEYPSSKEKQIFYRKMPGGWKDTPQHRIIFRSMIGGVPMTWQARYIEKVSDDGLNKYALHPYAGGHLEPGANLFPAMMELKNNAPAGTKVSASQGFLPGKGMCLHVWSHTHTRANPQAEWLPVSPFDELKDGILRFKPAKYRTAKYSSRELMGLDAAIERANNDPSDIKWVVLCEGPLDAARVGPGGVATIGSSISMVNAAKIVKNFHIVFLAYDTDVAGRAGTEKLIKMLNSKQHRVSQLIECTQFNIPEGKDLGEMKQEEFDKLFARELKRVCPALIGR